MPISFGNPGELRKTFDDGKFDLVGGVYSKYPCKLKAGEATAAKIRDGQFLSPDGNGEFEQAPDADRPLYLIFSANSEVIIRQVTSADDYPGEDRTDTPTGFVGEINGIWPQAVLFTGDKGGTPVTLASYTGLAKLTVFQGKLAPASGTDRVIGYVEAPSTVVGSQSIAARIHI